MKSSGADTVLIALAFNHERYLPQLFSSICANLGSLSELVLIDNGSSDDSLSMMRGFAASLPSTVNVQVQSNPPRTSVSFAVNQGLRATRASLVSVIAADDFLLPRRYEAQVACLNGDPAAMFCFSNGWVCNEDGILSDVPVHDRRTIELIEPAAGQRRRSLVYPIPALFTQCALFRRAALEAVGAWDESLAIDDWPLNIRLFARFPEGSRYVEGAVAAYRRHPTNVSKRRFRQYIGQKRVLEKVATGSDAVQSMFALFATQMLLSLKRRQPWRARAFAHAARRTRAGLIFPLVWLAHEIRRRMAIKIR